MSGARSYLLDTNVVLHATRENSAVSRAIDAQFGLSTSRFRPAICEVSIAELLAFAHSSTWGEPSTRSSAKVHRASDGRSAK